MTFSLAAFPATSTSPSVVASTTRPIPRTRLTLSSPRFKKLSKWDLTYIIAGIRVRTGSFHCIRGGVVVKSVGVARRGYLGLAFLKVIRDSFVSISTRERA